MRLVVTVSATSNPELHDDLERLSSRKRAERIRALSIIGLSLINGRAIRAELPNETLEPGENRKNLVRRLKGTLQS
jgi:hypothetical protein